VVFVLTWVFLWLVGAGASTSSWALAGASSDSAAVAVSAAGSRSVTLPGAADRVRIAEAWRIVDRLGDDLWPGFSEAPRAVLLVTPKIEYLFYHPSPTSEFVPLGFDSITSSLVFARSRVYDTRLLSTFPAVDGVPTVVIGEPRNTEASHSTRWVATLLHEHFHQYQQSQPRYYTDALALGLAGDDSTGMWMLNYPFPYDSRRVGEAFASLCRLLVDAVDAIGRPSFRSAVDTYLAAREEFRRSLSEKDYAYFSFQVWQEGIARYTEWALVRRAGVAYTLSSVFMSLPDRVPFDKDASETLSHVLTELRRMSLRKARRTARRRGYCSMR
jgi:hypothetical protein